MSLSPSAVATADSKGSPPAARRTRRWVDLGCFLLGCGFLAHLLVHTPFAEILSACRRIWPFVLVTPLIALGWNFCRTSGLSVLLEGRVPWLDLLWNRLVGDGYNAIVPLAGLGGEPWKLNHLAEYVETDQAVTALIRDRVIETSMGLLIPAVVIVATVGHFRLPAPLRAGLVIYAGLTALAGLLVGAVTLTPQPGRAGALVRRWLGGGVERAPRTLPLGRFARVAAWKLVAQLGGFVEIGALLWMLGLGFDPYAILFVDSALNAAGFVAFAVPQGIGVLEQASVYVFGLLGYASALGVAFALARRGRLLLVSLIGVCLHLGTRIGKRGRPQPKEVWDEEYRAGHWERLDSGEELGHYAVIAGFVQHFHPLPQILDVGCGHGRLFRLLQALPFKSYLGTDLSSEAIAKAGTLATKRARFCVANFEDATPEDKFDLVIFNESLYYARRPLEVLCRYAQALDDGGLLIVSMCHRPRSWTIWRAVAKRFRTIHSCKVQNERGQVWEVKALRP